MAVLGFLVTSDLTALPGSGHTTTIGAQLVPTQHLFSASVRIVEEEGQSIPCHVCFLSTVPTASFKGVPDIASPVALISHLLT